MIISEPSTSFVRDPFWLTMIEARNPFPLESLPDVWEWTLAVPRATRDDFSPQTLEEFLLNQIERSDDLYTWGIYRDEEIGGIVWVEQVSPIVVAAHCLFKKSFYGHRTTIPALNQIAAKLFAAGFEKIQMPTFADNHAIRSLIKKLGGKQEGLLRRHTRRDGQPLDVVIFGLLKDEWTGEPSPLHLIASSPHQIDQPPHEEGDVWLDRLSA